MKVWKPEKKDEIISNKVVGCDDYRDHQKEMIIQQNEKELRIERRIVIGILLAIIVILGLTTLAILIG